MYNASHLSHFPCFHHSLCHPWYQLLFTFLPIFKCVHISSAGLLDAVSNLKSESLGHIIRLTWDAPFSMDITGVDPDIWYRVDVTVDNSPFSSYNDIYVTEFNFTMDDHNDTNTSVIYEFRVTPINGAGNGTTSDPVTGYFIGCELINCYCC